MFTALICWWRGHEWVMTPEEREDWFENYPVAPYGHCNRCGKMNY